MGQDGGMQALPGFRDFTLFAFSFGGIVRIGVV